MPNIAVIDRRVQNPLILCCSKEKESVSVTTYVMNMCAYASDSTEQPFRGAKQCRSPLPCSRAFAAFVLQVPGGIHLGVTVQSATGVHANQPFQADISRESASPGSATQPGGRLVCMGVCWHTM